MQDTNTDFLYNKKPLPHAVQRNLVEFAQQGSKLAQDELVTTNMRFVYKMAKLYYCDGFFEINDLVSEGAAGLIHAIHKFELNSRLNFMTYAAFWIRAYISRFITEKTNTIRVPNSRRKEEKNTFISLEKPLNHETDTTLGDMIEQTSIECVEDTMEHSSIKEHIEVLLNQVSLEESEVLKYRYGLDGEELSLGEIALRMNVTHTRARHVCERGMMKLRKNLEFSPHRNHLLQYLSMAA